MLTELHLENWKSYQQATLYIDPIAVLIGVNASGKSNALDALQWLNRLAMGQSLTAALKDEGAQSAIRGGLEWAARQPGAQFTLSVLCQADTQTDYRYRISGVVHDNRCQVQAEQLSRQRYRQGKDCARKSLVASHVETQGFMRHEEPLVAPHRVIPAQAGIQVCPQRTAG